MIDLEAATALDHGALDVEVTCNVNSSSKVATLATTIRVNDVQLYPGNWCRADGDVAVSGTQPFETKAIRGINNELRIVSNVAGFGRLYANSTGSRSITPLFHEVAASVLAALPKWNTSTIEPHATGNVKTILRIVRPNANFSIVKGEIAAARLPRSQRIRRRGKWLTRAEDRRRAASRIRAHSIWSQRASP
jgi:hypothetical protein